MIRSVAIGFAIVMIILGILGYVPAVAPDNLLFGVFEVGPVHNAVHIATGAIALIVGFTTERAARGMFQFVGIVYAIVAIAGFFAGDDALLGIMAVNFADHILHVIIALLALGIGFAPSPERRYRQPGTGLQPHHETPRGT